MKRQRMIMIQDPVYHIPVVCIWGATERQFARTCEKHFGFDASYTLTCAGVFFPHDIDDGKTVAFIGLSDTFEGTPDQYATLSHEALHCTFHMLKDRGMPYSVKTEEGYCYFHSFLISTLAEEMLKVESKLESRRKKRANGS